MISVVSQKLQDGDNSNSFTYVYNSETDNTGVKEINEPLLYEEGNASIRAEAELIEGALNSSKISFITYNTDLYLSQSIKINGLAYKITKLSYVIDSNSGIVKVEAIRYDFM